MPTTAPPVSPEDLDLDTPMTWAEVCARTELDDLPYKIEQDRFGRIVMTPAPSRHSILQRQFQKILEDALGGVALPECPVQTAEGVRVADVAWMEGAFAQAHQDSDAFPVAPPICVEVKSKWNTRAEMEEKVTLYLARGAQEVWVHERSGRLRFFGHEGERTASALAPGAPATVTL